MRLALTVIDCNISTYIVFPVEPIEKDFYKARKKVVLNWLLRRIGLCCGPFWIIIKLFQSIINI